MEDFVAALEQSSTMDVTGLMAEREAEPGEIASGKAPRARTQIGPLVLLGIGVLIGIAVIAVFASALSHHH
jgi:hypothetical protein